MHSEAQPQSAKPQSLETRIGLYWLHRLGIVSLVFGVVFLILCSFASFSPLLKLLTGFGVSVALLLLGYGMARKEKSRWFAHGLTAAGWSLAYFTTYAAHYVPAVCVVPSLALETCLLMAVAAGSLGSALQARVELMAIYSVSLAALSILLSGPSLHSDVSFLIMAVTTSILGNRLGWRKLFTFGMVACYWGHFACDVSNHSNYDSRIGSAFLASIWLVFTIGLGYAVQASAAARKYVTILSCINAVVLAAGLRLSFTALTLIENELLLASASAVYLAVSRWLHNRQETQLNMVHSLLGLSLINLAKSMQFSGQSLLALDVMQIAILGTIGTKFNIQTFRWFAIGLTLLLFPAWVIGASTSGDVVQGFHSLAYFKLGIYATTFLGALACLHIRTKDTERLPKHYRYFYYITTNAMAMLTIILIADPSWCALALVCQAVINSFLADWLSDNVYVYPSAVCAAVAACVMMQHSWDTTASGLIVALLYSAYALNRYKLRSRNSSLGTLLQKIYAHSANVMLTLFICKQLTAAYISPALAMEGITLLLVGFLLRDRLFRLSGLAVLAILTGKLFFIDFARFDTIERVGAFIAAGIVFLLSSYGYARFTRSFEDEPTVDSMPQHESPDTGLVA